MIECKNCRNINPDNADFCSKCFIPLHETEVEERRGRFQENGKNKASVILVEKNKKRYDLYFGQNIIGRDRNANINLTRDESVSNRHSVILVNKKGCFIKDLKSTNGTWLSGRKVEDSFQQIKPGMKIICGRTELVLQKQ